MPHLAIFLISIAGGCLFGLLVASLVKDIIYTRLYNRVAHARGKPERLFRLFWCHTLAALSLGIALGFFGCASVTGCIFIRDALIH